jgi:hypothetical protein
MQKEGLASIDVRRDEQEAYVATCDAFLKSSTFALGGCSSYYLDDTHGRVSLVWPGSMSGLYRKLKKCDLRPYDTVVLRPEVHRETSRPSYGLAMTTTSASLRRKE